MKTRFETEAQGNADMALWFCINYALRHLVIQSEKKNQNQSRLPRTHFPALLVSYIKWLRGSIGSLFTRLRPLWLAILRFLSKDTQLKPDLKPGEFAKSK